MKSLVEMVLALKQIINLQMNLIERLLKHLRDEESTRPLETVFVVWTWLICNP